MSEAGLCVFLDRDSVDRGDLDFSALDRRLPNMVSYGATPGAQVVERIAEAEVVITNKVVLDEKTLLACPQLKLIIIAATGTNNIALEAAAKQGVAVCNVRDYATSSVAQHVFTLVLALARNLEPYAEAVRRGRWNESEFFCLLDYPIIDLKERTLGIIGYGTLGRAVAKLGEAFGMEIVIGARPGAPSSRDRLALDELFARSDVISLHCPLTAETRHLIDANALARMKHDAILINTARGGIVDEAALVDALSSGAIGGAGIDVLNVEPPDGSSVLLKTSLPNLIVTPHNAWASRRCRQRLVDQMVEIVQAWRNGCAINRVA